MYAASESVLQDSSVDVDLNNMYVASGHYICSEFGDVEHDEKMLSDFKSNVFVKASIEAQREGLDVVFGFAGAAGSGIQYYARQYVVKYASDENGIISGVNTEDIISGNHPSGSSTTPNEDYEIDYWIVDKNVALTDGTEIKAGKYITPEQIKQVVVNENLVFTAIHKTESNIAVPDTGLFTGAANAEQVVILLAVVLIGIPIVGSLPKIFHKKIGFKKS